MKKIGSNDKNNDHIDITSHSENDNDKSYSHKIVNGQNEKEKRTERKGRGGRR